MKTEFKNKRNMYTVVLSTCKKHQAIWSNVPAFVASVNDLENKVAEFTETAQKRLLDTSNITKGKVKLMGVLHEKMYAVVKIIQAYALHEGLHNLATEYSITKNSLLEGGAKAAVNRYNNIVKKATELAPDLEALGLSAQILQEITQEVEEAKKVIHKPRLAIIKRKMLNKRLEQLIDEMDELVFTHLSSMVLIMQFNHPMFYAEFMAARNIIDQKGPRKGGASNAEVENESPPQDEGEIDDSA